MGPLLLIHPPIREWAKPCNLPLGVLYTAAAVMERHPDLSVTVADMNAGWSEDYLLDFMRSTLVRTVGISGIASQYRYIKSLVSLVRSVHPEYPIVVGGPIAVLGEKLVDWLGVHVFRGESEITFPALVAADAFDAPPKVWDGEVVKDLDALPHPTWHLANTWEYAQNPVGAINKAKWAGGEGAEGTPMSLNLLAARGCPFECTFCSHDFLGTRYRQRSVGSVMNEIAELRHLYGVAYVHLSDDNTLAKESWVNLFCDALRTDDRLHAFTWGCAGRTTSVNVDLLLNMRTAGCRIVGMGVESGSQKMLDAYNKRATVEDNVNAINDCQVVFGKANYSLMVGGIGEDDTTIDETIAMCHATHSRPEVVFFTTPMPGSAIYEYALKTGLIENEQGYLCGLGENSDQIACNISGQSDKWLWNAKKKIVAATAAYGGAI